MHTKYSKTSHLVKGTSDKSLSNYKSLMQEKPPFCSVHSKGKWRKNNVEWSLNLLLIYNQILSLTHKHIKGKLIQKTSSPLAAPGGLFRPM